MNINNRRQGQMDFSDTFFYTDSIYGFKHLLADDSLKMKIIQSWQYLVNKQLVEIYGYVIMPNHIHLIWRILESNGKESPAGSFAKFTGHQFKNYLLMNDPVALKEYCSDKKDRLFQFWKRDPLAIRLSTISILEQKLHYIHNNPIQGHWKLATFPEDYRWSSASYYYKGYDEFNIISHYKGLEGISVGEDTDR